MSSVVLWMCLAIWCPCARPNNSVRRISMSSVPCSSPVVFMVDHLPSFRVDVRPREKVDHDLPTHRCCATSTIGSALVGFDVRQHARAESISKRAPSTSSELAHHVPLMPCCDESAASILLGEVPRAGDRRAPLIDFASQRRGLADIPSRLESQGDLLAID